MDSRSLKRLHLFFVLLLGGFTASITLVNSAQAFDEREFEENVEQYVRRYGDFASQDVVQRLLVDGKVDTYFERLVQMVPDEDKGFYDYFVLANLLFAEDRDRSFAYMKRAERLQRDNPYVWYERGIHEHRAGNCEDASRYYRRFHGTAFGRDNSVSWAYLTHCALLLGDSDEALSSWANADFRSHHTSIEKGMYAVFSKTEPNRERQAIITRITAGEHQLFCDLIDHDRHWEIDWWNHVSKESYLSFDNDLADRVLQKGSGDEEVFRLCLMSKDMTDDEFLNALADMQIWGETAILPKSSALVFEIARRLAANNLASPEKILQVFESQLEERLDEQPGDRRFLEVLGFLYSATGNKAELREVDYHGWHEMKLEKFAGSYLLGVDPASTEYESLLDEALADFPNNSLLNQLRMAKSASEPERGVAIARYVASEFANVKENWSGPYRLSDYMASFAFELGQSADRSE